QAVVHIALLGLTAATLAIKPDELWKPVDNEFPAAWLLLLLSLSVGPPFFVLTATSPLLQSWYGRAGYRSPYWLYGVSNLGSMIGLLSCPFVVEPLLGLRAQTKLWSSGFLLFAVLCAAAALAAAVSARSAALSRDVGRPDGSVRDQRPPVRVAR